LYISLKFDVNGSVTCSRNIRKTSEKVGEKCDEEEEEEEEGE